MIYMDLRYKVIMQTEKVPGSTCLCRPVYQVPASAAAAESPPVPSTDDISSQQRRASVSSSTTPSAGRVQKHTRKNSSLQKPSDNVIRALNLQLEQNACKNGFIAAAQNNLANHPSTYSPPQLSTCQTAQLPPSELNGKSKQHGCCSIKSETISTPAALEIGGTCCRSSVTIPKDHSAPQNIRSSCCRNGQSDQKDGELLLETEKGLTPVWNGSMDHSQNLVCGANSGFAYNTPFYTTTDWGSQDVSNIPQSDHYNTPRSAHVSSKFNQNHPGGTSMHQFHTHLASHTLNIPPSIDDSNHVCLCGDGCQCLGCASHPFNETTRQHVQEMGYMMTVGEEEENSGGSSPFTGLVSPSSYPFTNQRSRTATPSWSGFVATDTSTSNFDNTLKSSALSSDQLMLTSQYYTLEYPVGLNLCSNMTGTCQCGNDCTCVGCITHSGHDGVVFDSTTPENQPVSHQSAPISQRSDDYYGPNLDTRGSIDQYSVSMSSPPVVETPLV